MIQYIMNGLPYYSDRKRASVEQYEIEYAPSIVQLE